ncbi:hypothetical protein BS78_03G240200 [Paspalum vaginatum]|nr:hypothetical protein BS78_03G240200 [Paspalum vaginatum]
MEGDTVTRRDGGELDPLALTLGSIYASAATTAAPAAASPLPLPLAPSPPPPSPPPPPPAAADASRATRRRLNNGSSAPSRGVRRPCAKPRDDVLVTAPFPWATERPARHDSLDSLLRRGVTSVEGQARCKRCGARKGIAYDLQSKFYELRDYISAHRHTMYDRAPDAWMFPALPDCDACGHKAAVWPEIAADKSQINWMFLLLGQMLGCCTLDQLKYFCMNTGRHRTGAKNRVLYYAYVEMCNQLQPFD